MSRDTSRVLATGLAAGLAGYATVVVFFAVTNAISGRSAFYTAALLGSAMFYGARTPAEVAVAAGPVLAYNMVHMFVFLGLGFFAAAMVELAERHPVARYAVLVALLFVAGHVFGTLIVFTHGLVTGTQMWTIGAATVAAAAVMLLVLLALHPVLRAGLRTLPLGSE